MNTELPSIIVSGDLTIEEIGAIFITFSLKNVGEDVKNKWINDPELSRIYQELQKKNMLKNEDGKLVIDIIDQTKDSFFYIEDYDDKDNPIYASPSVFGTEENGLMSWRVKPELWDLNIVWVNCSDSDLMTDDIELTFDSLEQAEEYFREQNAEIMASFQEDL
jgi:hypothetical protein